MKSYPDFKLAQEFSIAPMTSRPIKSFNDIESELAQMQYDFFMEKNQLQKDIVTLADEIDKVDTEIEKLDEENDKLKKKLYSLEGRKEGSQGMVYDEQILL